MEVPFYVTRAKWPNVRTLSTHLCPKFFVGGIYDKFLNIHPTKNAKQKWVLNALILLDQQMLYNNVEKFSPGLTALLNTAIESTAVSKQNKMTSLFVV